MSSASHILFVGIGSAHGDDRIGWSVADGLSAQLRDDDGPPIRIRKASVPLDILDWLHGVEQLHVCDACFGDQPVGTVLRLEAGPSDTRDGTFFPEFERLRGGGSHDFGLAAVFQLAQRLGRLPSHVVVHAVVGRRFEPGDAPSDELASVLPEVVQTILKELQCTKLHSCDRS